jgi:FkbM family methyltransferase
MSDHNYLYFSKIEEGDRILVLGAAGGDFIQENYREVIEKGALVFCVEPVFDNLQHLISVCKTLAPQNTVVLSCGVSDTHRVEKMEVRDNLITSTLESRFETNQRWPMPLLYKMNAPIVTLDTILSIAGRIDKVFCDIEGSELEVFSTSKRISEIPYFAIASYHLRDGRRTAEQLTRYFPGYHVVITDKVSRLEGEVVLFAWRRDAG